MKRVLIPGVILCGADVAQAVDDKNMYMHVFEEMTVYAPVPVPVNGNTHYTSESIERLPTGNGNISDLLRTNPAVRMDSTQSTSLNQGDIRPEKISIHGASPYQNAYLIDGISATNNLNPANESDASSATNISGMSQGYYLDVSLLDNVTLYDSFVPVEFGRFNGGVIDAKIKRFNADDSSVKHAAGKKTNHTIYHKGKGSLGIDNYTLYMADRISWRNVSLMPGVRYDYDNYLSNHNISPRFMTEWDIFADQTSMITAGYNRYYGGNILDMGLRDIRNSWTESVSGNKTLTRYQDLKTPYNDELAMGLQQKIGKNVIARANYVYREAHDQISKSSRTDSATKTTITEYNNDGKTKTHSFNLSFELAEPLHISQVDINPQIVFSYIKSKGNLSLNNGYEESNTGDNQVVYNGNLVSYDSVPVADFNNPLKISLNMDFTHQPSGLVWANTLAWQEARKARIILGKTNAQYISEYSDYKQYVDEKLDSSLTWDTRLSWTPQFLKQQNLTISADILNVLDSKTAVDTTNTGVATYASGRTFWLDVSMKF
ncbi:TonB-dependent receptor plug domain-containing protein [Escherichia coli]|uniref:TonB-dependent receptor plug domain-containing protein n=1 Tax=Escherichia coli TaxID=562 RepID=A0A8S7B3S0_ECOLX|nr:TonB-dependent receptor plug domain-containing protein [Escherichia coli]